MTSDPSAGPRAAPHRRRTLLLDRSFQLRYSLLLATLGAAAVTLFGALAYQVHASAMAATVGGAAGEVSTGGQTLLWLTVVGALGTAVVLGLFGLLLTHRVAGPVHVMGLYMAALAAGRYPRLRPLRKRDELRSFFERFREAVDRIRAREADEARALGHVLGALAPIAVSPEAREALATLESLHARKRQAAEGAGDVAFTPGS
ncbi:HAMP domain-containing protein [Aggregicoccus sp. 17bor-14]|uniref:HAMP domain-containing protein n=1 Tax=Myxococcaceae TaxID=31 RepID=UPI00129C145A|nr:MULTISPECIES: HAMP domain-containing protein [Myxococcaceae]MBF5043654.1 HAMP domain-containing protein [Simulacricoccus sp. 17bor-14]MRI89413.1 HAMP domain-containing protein [Aggregicoccus sp. 17bor-14]